MSQARIRPLHDQGQLRDKLNPGCSSTEPDNARNSIGHSVGDEGLRLLVPLLPVVSEGEEEPDGDCEDPLSLKRYHCCAVAHAPHLPVQVARAPKGERPCWQAGAWGDNVGDGSLWQRVPTARAEWHDQG